MYAGRIMNSAEARDAKNSNAVMAGWVDRGPWQYWDTITGAAGAALAAQYNPFSVARGQQNPLTGATKTDLETNMLRGNEFPPPRCLLLIQIGIYFSSRMFKEDIDRVLDNTWLQFKIDDKVFHEGQLWQFPGGVGLTGVTMNAGEAVYTLGVPAPAYTRRYNEWAKYIAPQQQFSMAIYVTGTQTMDSEGPGLYMVVFMDGLTDRSVQ
jgi:hypothetical protein